MSAESLISPHTGPIIWKLIPKITKIHKYSQIFPNIPKNSQIFPNILKYSQIFPKIHKYSQILNWIEEVVCRDADVFSLRNYPLNIWTISGYYPHKEYALTLPNNVKHITSEVPNFCFDFKNLVI